MNRALRTLVLPTAALTTALALTACGNTASPGSASTGMPGIPGMNSTTSTTTAPTGSTGTVGPPAIEPHNSTDIAFATDMIPHHAQAVQMADLAATTATNADLTSLASQIKAAQDPEIATMTGWLTGWGAPVPTAGGHDMSGMTGMTSTSPSSSDAAGAPMGGMMSDQEMADLSRATGTGFDRMWLQMMTRHHQGAVAMAQTELSAGQNAQAKVLAQSIIDGQTKEITTMTKLLATLEN